MSHANINIGQIVMVAGKRGTILEVSDKVKVKFDDGSFGFFDQSVMYAYVDDTRLKSVMADTVMMHSTAAGEDPLAQPRRATGRSVGEEQTVLGKSVTRDLFAK